MVDSTLKLMLRGVKKGRFGANYNCYSFFYNYSIIFPEYFIEFIFSIGRNYALIEKKSIAYSNEVFERFSVPIPTFFKITYRPPPGKVSEFERDIYRKYCDELRSKFNGCLSWHCEAGMNDRSCPILGDVIYRLYFHLDNDYIFPFLSHLLKAKFHIESCTPFMIRTKNVILFPSGVFSYRGRFNFSSDNFRFSIDCNHPYTSIKNAIRRIMDLL